MRDLGYIMLIGFAIIGWLWIFFKHANLDILLKYLDDYMHFAGGNEAPKIYHLWSALSALSATIGKRVRFDLGYFPIMTNMYVVLVGSPGVAKTTAMNIAKNLVRDLKDIPICADAVTREKLVQMIGRIDSPSKKTVKYPDGKISEFSQMSIFSSEARPLPRCQCHQHGRLPHQHLGRRCHLRKQNEEQR